MLQKRPMTPPPFCFLSGIQPRHPKSSPFRKKIFNQHWHCQWQASLKTENLAKKYNRHGIAAISRLPKIPLKERRREGLSLTTDIQYPLPHKKTKNITKTEKSVGNKHHQNYRIINNNQFCILFHLEQNVNFFGKIITGRWHPIPSPGQSPTKTKNIADKTFWADSSLDGGSQILSPFSPGMTLTLHIPDICQFWDTTALYSPIKVRQKVRHAQQISHNMPKGTDLKKVHHRRRRWWQISAMVFFGPENIDIGESQRAARNMLGGFWISFHLMRRFWMFSFDEEV